jgi:KaiC/GvpD/RAD55 family RecA-like ATPase
MENHLKGINKLLNDDTPKQKPASKKKTQKKKTNKHKPGEIIQEDTIAGTEISIVHKSNGKYVFTVDGKSRGKGLLSLDNAKEKFEDLQEYLRSSQGKGESNRLRFVFQNPQNDEGAKFIKELKKLGATNVENKSNKDSDVNTLNFNYKGRKIFLFDNSGEFKVDDVTNSKSNEFEHFATIDFPDTKINNKSRIKYLADEVIEVTDERIKKMNLANKGKSQQKKKPTPNKKTANKKQTNSKKKVNKAVNKTAINHYSESFKLLRRLRNFLRKDVVSFQQIRLLYMAYSKAAIEKKLDQNDPYYDLYKKANDVVVKMYKAADEKKDSYKDTGFNVVDTESNIYKKIDDLINSKKIDIGVRLTKRFVNIQGTSPDKAKAKRLLKSIENAIDKDNIKEGNRLFDEVKKARKELNDYIKNDDPIEVTKYSVKKKVDSKPAMSGAKPRSGKKLKKADNSNLSVDDIRKKIEKYLSSIEEIDYGYAGKSETNGLSIYYIVRYKDNEVKARFSDHSVTNKDRVQNEVHYQISKLSEFDKNTPKLMYKLGHPNYEFGPTKTRKAIMEIPLKNLKKNDKEISRRKSKKGNTFVKIEKEEKYYFDYYKKEKDNPGMKGVNVDLSDTVKKTADDIMITADQVKEFANRTKETVDAVKKVSTRKKNADSRISNLKGKKGDKDYQFFNVAGQTGQFLQNVERKPKESIAITLDGPHGAGKTTTVWKMMNDFAGGRNDVLFLSLEEHPESFLVQDKIDLYIDDDNLDNIDMTGDVDSKEHLYKLIEDYDIIFLDSWQKLLEYVGKIKFDQELRKKVDSKVFVVIFQQTVQGKTKGGAEISFDGDIIIKLHKDETGNFANNYAYFDKHRYTKKPIDKLKYYIASGQFVDETQQPPAPAEQAQPYNDNAGNDLVVSL